MTKALIITVDDFGLGPGVNRAVTDAQRAGVVTAASLMVTFAGFQEAVELAQDMPGLDVGLHCVLAKGRPVSPPREIPSLVSGDGAFVPRHRLLLRALMGRLRSGDVARELEAQLERLVRAGITPSFLNGDQHVHLLPVIRDVVLNVARRQRLAVRVPREERIWVRQGTPLLQWRRIPPRLAVKTALGVLVQGIERRSRAKDVPTNDHFLSPFGLYPSPSFTVGAFQSVLQRLRDGLTELMVHPAYPDEATARFWSGGQAQARERQIELATLLDPRFASLLKETGASLTTYAKALGTPRPVEVSG